MSNELSGEQLDIYFQTKTGLDISVKEAYEIYTKEKKTPQDKKILEIIKHTSGTDNPWIFRWPDRIIYYEQKVVNQQ